MRAAARRSALIAVIAAAVLAGRTGGDAELRHHDVRHRRPDRQRLLALGRLGYPQHDDLTAEGRDRAPVERADRAGRIDRLDARRRG
jgi:hypothetical protein